MSNYLPHFAEAKRRHKLVADQKLLLYTITDSHNSNFTKSCELGRLFKIFTKIDPRDTVWVSPSISILILGGYL